LETVKRPTHPKLSLQRLNVPQEVRGVFIPAAIAGFAGLAICGFFTSIAPAMMGNVLGYDNRLLIGVVSASFCRINCRCAGVYPSGAPRSLLA